MNATNNFFFSNVSSPSCVYSNLCSSGAQLCTLRLGAKYRLVYRIEHSNYNRALVLCQPAVYFLFIFSPSPSCMISLHVPKMHTTLFLTAFADM